MNHAFPALRPLADGEVLGARSWCNLLSRRSNYLYGFAHGAQRPFRQQEIADTIGITCWEGDVSYDSERPVLHVCARIKQTVGDTVLSYYGVDDAWHAIWTDSDTSAAWRYLTGTATLTQDCSGYDLPADGVLHIRLVVGSAAALMVYAFMTGTNPTTWPASLPTFADGVGNEPVDDDLNALRTMQTYERWAADRALLGSAQGKASQDGTGYLCLYRWCFRYSGTQQLRLNLTTEGLYSDAVYVYLCPSTYVGDAGDSRLATLETITTEQTAADHAYDLTGQGLTVGNLYTVELGATSGAYVTINDIVLEDLPALTRANVPATWAHKDHITAAQLNAIKTDLVEMRDDAGSDSPIWPESWLSAYHQADLLLGLNGPFYQAQRFRFTHRERFLWYRGSGRACSVATVTRTVWVAGVASTQTVPMYEYALSEGDVAGAAVCQDTEDVEWLAGAYGLEYYVESYGSSAIQSAWESAKGSQ